MNFKIKRVYEPAEASDGCRVLVDRLWPRGKKKQDFDFWMRDVAPSTSLREWFHEDMETRWEEFKKKYRQELERSSAVKDFISKIKGKKTVTLLYASKNVAENHAVILRDFLRIRVSLM